MQVLVRDPLALLVAANRRHHFSKKAQKRSLLKTLARHMPG